LVTSKFGRVLTAIRDAESRVMFIGYNPLWYKPSHKYSAILCGTLVRLQRRWHHQS
ncbi:MAG: hypothetical protein IPL29_06400, partial [Propionivibrio sp.]|nr:hypothetical protein [Propionivibrio sp.]